MALFTAALSCTVRSGNMLFNRSWIERIDRVAAKLLVNLFFFLNHNVKEGNYVVILIGKVNIITTGIIISV